jgi:hypothetical protein
LLQPPRPGDGDRERRDVYADDLEPVLLQLQRGPAGVAADIERAAVRVPLQRRSLCGAQKAGSARYIDGPLEIVNSPSERSMISNAFVP